MRRLGAAGVGAVVVTVCAVCCLAAYAVLFAHGWATVARLGDDGIRVRPVSRTGLVVTAIVPGSPAAGKDVSLGSVIDGVDGLVTRDERALLRAFASRPAGRESRLHLQDIPPGGGTGAGMGATRVVTVVPRPRLSTPAVVAGLRIAGVAGCVALAAAIASAICYRGARTAWGSLVAAGAVAGIMLVRLFADAGYATWLLAPPLLTVVLAAAAVLLTTASRRGPLIGAASVAAAGGAAALILTAVPFQGLDPGHVMVAADAGLASLALIPIAASFSSARRRSPYGPWWQPFDAGTRQRHKRVAVRAAPGDDLP